MATAATALLYLASEGRTGIASLARRALWAMACEPQSGPQSRSSQRLLRNARSAFTSWLTLSFNRTALYGPVRRVVWEGGAARLLPIPITSVRAWIENSRRRMSTEGAAQTE